MLHAFFVSPWDAASNDFLQDDSEAGAELWAYLPGSFLPHLKGQPLDDDPGALSVHLDGPPVVRELFLDLNGDGLYRWHTLLEATGTLVQSRRSNLLVLDITDPYQPELLWETLLPGNEIGRTRGVTIDRCGSVTETRDCIYLTADSVGGDGPAAIHARGRHGDPLRPARADPGFGATPLAIYRALPDKRCCRRGHAGGSRSDGPKR